jgi:uncharacterized protein (TIGR03000 family)
MLRQRPLAATVGVVALLLTPAVSCAQRGGGHGGGGHAGGAHGGGAHVGGSGYYHSGYGYNRGYGGSLYVIPSIYLAPSGGYGAPTVYASPAASYYYGPSADLRSGYGPSADLRPGSAPVPATPTNLAYLDVRVPPDAQVWVDGDPTTQTGGERSFVSPPLEPGRIFMYEIRARWLDNGEVVDLTKQVRIRAGDRVPVDFLAR